MSVRQDINPKWVSSFFVQLHWSIQCWKMDKKDISDATKLVKEHVQYSLKWGTSGQLRQDHIWIRKGEPKNEGSSWNGKLIRKLLLTITVADPERFTPKGKPVIYMRVFVELYNWRNRGQIHEIRGMVKLKKMCVLIAKNSRNLGACRMIEIFSILYNAHVIFRNQDKVVFYVNNYIDWDQFNQLYNLD